MYAIASRFLPRITLTGGEATGDITISGFVLGIFADARSRTNLKSDCSLVLDQVSTTPLDVALEAIFQVYSSADFDISL